MACTELDFWGQQSDGLIKLWIEDFGLRISESGNWKIADLAVVQGAKIVEIARAQRVRLLGKGH